jgi:hypothetical protein
MKTRLVHNGTVSTAGGGFAVGDTVGAIYLGDIGRRIDKGTLEYLGQDFYLNPGDDVLVEETGEVLLSASIGSLKTFSDLGVVSITHGVTG